MPALSEKDTNVSISPKKSQQSSDEQSTMTAYEGQQDLLKKTSASNGSGAYISPSDAIMSPASQKLANFKQKQINKQDTARRSLFARTLSNNSEKSGKSLDDWK